MANRGHSYQSNARIEPINLKEKLAMEQAMSNPLAGKQIPIELRDPRWLASEGWVKMQQRFVFADNTTATIHYVLNRTLQLMDDFKFII